MIQLITNRQRPPRFSADDCPYDGVWQDPNFYAPGVWAYGARPHERSGYDLSGVTFWYYHRAINRLREILDLRRFFGKVEVAEFEEWARVQRGLFRRSRPCWLPHRALLLPTIQMARHWKEFVHVDDYRELLSQELELPDDHELVMFEVAKFALREPCHKPKRLPRGVA